jgi:hypothetical protein
MMDFKGQSHSKCPSACGMAMWKVATTKLITIERFFSAGFHEISAPKSHVLYQSYKKSL